MYQSFNFAVVKVVALNFFASILYIFFKISLCLFKVNFSRKSASKNDKFRESNQGSKEN